jgi:gliding motility-associated-like protein
LNPAFFTFKCLKTGTWTFLLTTIQISDYDWALFDITGRGPKSIYSGQAGCVVSNWAGTTGNTGTSADAANLHECGGWTRSPFSKMPVIDSGHTYLLLVSNWLADLSDYYLNFEGGTSEIGGNVLPQAGLLANCQRTELRIFFNLKLPCPGIASDGSDWQLQGNGATIISAYGTDCGGNTESDTIVLKLSNALPPGSVRLRLRKGSDGNTMLDACNNLLPEGFEVTGTIPPPVPPLRFDSANAKGCEPTGIRVRFTVPYLCASLAADGSDFSITGPGQVQISGAAPVLSCVSGQTQAVWISFTEPITTGGSYRVSMRKGYDGNTLLNACNEEMPAGSSIEFFAPSSVNAQFAAECHRGCVADTFRYVHDGGNGVNRWEWRENGILKAGGPVFQQVYPNAQNAFQVKIGLVVTNGMCADTIESQVALPDQRIRVAFTSPDNVCGSDAIQFTDNSTGPVTSWLWAFGNGSTSTLQHPPAQQYTSNGYSANVMVSLTAANSIGCSQQARRTLTVYSSCNVTVATAFTPNGDGLNDYLYPLNGWAASDLRFLVYNRYGQVVWQTTDWTRKWDGRIAGNAAPAGSYIWMLEYTDARSGKKVAQKGTALLIR